MLNKRFGFENKADACLYEVDGQGGDEGRDLDIKSEGVI